ncbi:hypothetical protein RZS08_35830, partial [Arthrospira platensis SPKY1]|nr:hypothetical protein [Arthrospira platensis SPKY1]
PTALNYNPNATVDDGSCEYDDPVALAFCADAISVACFQTYAGSTAGADVQDEAPDCGTSVTAPGVWHSYVGTGRNVEINTCGSGFDTKLTVVTADCETGAIECVAANDDDCGLQSSVTFPAAFGQTFYILVHGFGNASGDYVL